MFFYIGILIIAASCSIISIRTLVGYSNVKISYKILISILICFGWFFPVIINIVKNKVAMAPAAYNLLYNVGYTLFGFMFILFTMLMLRDILWYMIYGIAKLMHHASWKLNPKNIDVLDYANVIIVFISIAIGTYAYKEGTKIPEFKEITIKSSKINEDIKAIHISDMHINRATPSFKIQEMVNKINMQIPDVIFMTGDIIDDDTIFIKPHLEALSNLSAKYGVYSSAGNHEFYNGLGKWIYSFKQMNFKTLFNQGEVIGDTNIFVAGIPDSHTAISHPVFNVDFIKALKGSSHKNFKILLSHNPDMIDNITSVNFGLQLSGHTHGGQIFPFHFLVKKANKYLAGEYKINGVDLHISRGAGTWGPPLRLFAPSDVTIINLKAEK